MSFRHLLFAGFSILPVIGCGDDPTAGLGTPVTVTGKVTLDGEPAGDAQVTFAREGSGAPPQFRNYATMTKGDGTYEIKNVYPAQYRVQVSEKPVEDPTDPEAEIPALDTGRFSKYGLNSELKANVSKSQSKFDYELTSG